ncbi:MAG: class I SAM-dependent methyltransferase [Deltaproteobacteria bacterium]|nr:class I SAM-dependent methyltransferase [Deltaproteobacteria bacterium]
MLHERLLSGKLSRIPGADCRYFLSPLVRCLTPGSSILDVGCGSGRDMRWLKDRGFRPTGFERSGGLAALAREHSGCPVLEGDFEGYDFSGMDVDAILLVGALVHVPHEPFSKILSNIAQALNPEGHVLLTLKEGVKTRDGAGGRVFYLWKDGALRAVFENLNLAVVDFSRAISKIRKSDVWLGYVLEKQDFGGDQRIV